MQGSLSLRSGVLYVGRHAATAHVRAYDLDGRALTGGFAFRSAEHGGARVSGLDVDRDRTLWIADAAAGSVRSFSLFGLEGNSFAHLRGAPPNDTRDGEDRRGDLAGISDVAIVEDDDDEDRVLIACAGRRRHALSIARLDGSWCRGLRSRGHPLGSFHGLARATAHGRWVWACETGAARIQVFRDGEFHFEFRLAGARGSPLEPTAAAPLADGRWIVAVRGAESALLVVDAAGRTLRALARSGEDTGSVEAPEDVVVEQGRDLAHTRVAVLDRDAERVQVFTIEGRCYGALEALPGEAQ